MKIEEASEQPEKMESPTFLILTFMAIFLTSEGRRYLGIQREIIFPSLSSDFEKPIHKFVPKYEYFLPTQKPSTTIPTTTITTTTMTTTEITEIPSTTTTTEMAPTSTPEATPTSTPEAEPTTTPEAEPTTPKAAPTMTSEDTTTTLPTEKTQILPPVVPSESSTLSWIIM